MSPPNPAPAASKGSSAPGVILFPGPGPEWEVWENPGTDHARLRPKGMADLPSGTEIAAAALPAQSVLNFVFRAPPADAATLRTLATVQLEQFALATQRGQPAVFDAAPSGPSDGQPSRRILVEDLDGILPPELTRPGISRFETSARMLPLPDEGCALWIENNRLVLAVARGGELLYFQSLSDARLTPAVLDELRSLGRILKMEGLMSEAPAVWVWTDLGPGVEAALGPLLGGRVTVSPRPAPRLPSRVGGLIPSSVAAERLQRQTRTRRRWVVTGVAVLYLAVMGVWVGMLVLRDVASRRLRTVLDGHRAKVEQLQSAALSWKRMQPSVDPANFPLMLLLQIRTAMPEKDLWLTEFRIANGVVDLRGATTEVDLVYKFRQKLGSNPEGGGIEWDFDTPTIQADNLTQFRVQGKLPDATAD